MPRPPTPVHNLRPNHKEWTPAHVIFLDTETRTIEGSDPEVLALRCWAAHLEDRRAKRGGQLGAQLANGATAEQLADQLEDWGRGRQTIWVYAHNLSFDLVTTRLPLVLAERGWTVSDAAIGGKAPWLRLARGTHRLTLVDSWSWLPVALGTVAERVRIVKPGLPAQSAGADEWMTRCEADVAILAAAVLDLMAWWDKGKLGRWNISGASCGWNAYRHIPTSWPVTIDPDPVGVAADRAANYGGRRGIWRAGVLHAGPFLELDFVAAYPSVAAELPLPMKRAYAFDSMAVDDRRVSNDYWQISARVIVNTDTPRWPVRVGGATFYPVGRFQTDLAGPDIAEAARLGCLESIGPGYVHRLGYAMAPWAAWCLDVQNGRDPDAPPVAAIAAKSWGRAVLGKWGARNFVKYELGPAPGGSWGYEEGWDHQSQTKGGLVTICGRRWWVTSEANGENAYPAILAWVEADVRVRLSRVIEAIGPGAVIQCDTDGLIVAQRLIGTKAAKGHLIAPESLSARGKLDWVLNCLHPVTAPLTLRVKRSAPHIEVLGPQHLKFAGQRSFSGLRADAAETAPNTYTGRIWPKLQWQMQHGDPAGYVRPEVTSVIRGPYAAGWVTTRGHVVPPAARITADGTTVLAGWHDTPGKLPGDQLGAVQHPYLMTLW